MTKAKLKQFQKAQKALKDLLSRKDLTSDQHSDLFLALLHLDSAVADVQLDLAKWQRTKDQDALRGALTN